MTNLTPGMIRKAKVAKSAEELKILAKQNDLELTDEEAAAYFAQIHASSGELDDDELDNVAGGGCGANEEPITYPPIPPYATYVRMINGCRCPSCGSTAGYVGSIDENAWSVSCVDWDGCKPVTGSGRASFWQNFERG